MKGPEIDISKDMLKSDYFRIEMDTSATKEVTSSTAKIRLF